MGTNSRTAVFLRANFSLAKTSEIEIKWFLIDTCCICGHLRSSCGQVLVSIKGVNFVKEIDGFGKSKGAVKGEGIHAKIDPKNSGDQFFRLSN